MEVGQQPTFFIGKMDSKKIELKTYELIEDYLESIGYELILVEFLRDQKGWVLRLYIDKEGGVTISDCSRVSELVNPILDVEMNINFPYNFEVSSPGLNRPLRKLEHFQKVIGENVKIQLKEPIKNNRQNIKGVLKKVINERVIVETYNEELEIPISQIKKANRIYKF
jgi:ribosome maturation factor RimP